MSGFNETDDVPAGTTGAAEVDQIRVYLLADDVGVPDGALREGVPRDEIVEIDTQDLSGYLVVDAPEPSVPTWVRVLEAASGTSIAYAGNQHLSAVLFVREADRWFALTFGFGRNLLLRDAIVPDFGLYTAASLINPDAVASVDSRAFEATVLAVRRQSSRGTRTRAIGLDAGREMLRALAGAALDPDLATRVTGADSLGLTASLPVSGIGPKLRALFAAYEGRAYKASFGFLDRWQRIRASDELHEELDEELVSVLARLRERVLDAGAVALPAGSSPVMTAPQVIDYASAGFLSTPEKDIAPRGFPELEAYLRALGRDATIADLRRHELFLIGGEPNTVEAIWPIYRALTWETTLDDESFVLADGTWWRVDQHYRDRIDRRLLDIPESDLARPQFAQAWDEDEYNKELAATSPGPRFLFDRRIATFADEEGGVEPCDVLTGDRRLVHVKRMSGSDAMSHLFDQALVSARLFAESREFRYHMRGLLGPRHPLLSMVPADKPVIGDYRVTLGIITRDAPAADGSFPHVSADLPFLARNFLFHIATDIERLGFNLELARILIDRTSPAPPPTRGGKPRWSTTPRRAPSAERVEKVLRRLPS